MTMEYIRNTFAVPAKRGMQVRFVGPSLQFNGTILSSDGSWLRVRRNDTGRVYTVHPSWYVQYLTEEKK